MTDRAPAASLRIAMLSDDYLPNPGGIASHVYELSAELAELGHRVDLYAGHDRRHEGPGAAPEGVRLVRNRAFAWTAAGRLGVTADTAWRLRLLEAQRRYDVCHWHNLAWESWAARLGAPRTARVFTNHSSGFERRLRSGLRRRHQLPRILGFAHMVITPSEAREVLTRQVGVPAERIVTIHHGVRLERFSPGRADPGLARRLGIAASDLVLVVPARLEKVKGVDRLVDALPWLLRRTPDLRLVLLGGGSQAGPLARRAARLRVAHRVVFCGGVPREDMAAHLRLATLVVLPSRAEGGLPLAAIEALACGRPLAATRVGGLADIEAAGGEDGAVTLFSYRGPEAMAQVLGDLLARAREAQGRAREEARRIAVERFGWRRCAERTLEVYRGAMAVHEGSRPR